MNIFKTLLLEPLANGLIVFYRLSGNNLGLAIILFSIFLRILLSPLTKPYIESMKKIKEYAPQIEKLRKKYKNDQKAFLKAQADFYREKKINPGAGCLPYLLQIVILIALFNVFSKTLVNGDTAARFNEFLYPPLKFSQNETVNTKFFYLDLTKPDTFKVSFLPTELPGFFLLLTVILQFYLSRLSLGLSKSQASIVAATEEKVDDFQLAMQKSMVYSFPVITLLVGLRFASGLVIYWLVFSLFQIWQQMSKEFFTENLRSFFESNLLLKSPKNKYAKRKSKN